MKFFEGWNRFLNESEDVDVYAKTNLQKHKDQKIETDEYVGWLKSDNVWGFKN